MIPASCIENFYDDPDSIRDFALSLDYYPPNRDENFPGVRTNCLSSIDDNFFQFSTQRFLSCFFDLTPDTTWKGTTTFHKIHTYNQDKFHPMNIGWIHRDEKQPYVTIAGVLYLNKHTNLDSGTKIFHLKKKFKDHRFTKREYLMQRRLNNRDLCLNKCIDPDLYINEIENHNNKFDLSIEYKNFYNRMIAYDGNLWHQISSFWVPEKFRLTQVFFIELLNNIPHRKKPSLIDSLHYV